MESVLVTKQRKTFRREYTGADGRPELIVCHVRYDDECGNGHNTFAMTADIYTRDRQHGETTAKTADGKTLWMSSCGCQHEAIAKHFPDLAKYLKWHLCSSDGPLHYPGNALYHAGDKDCHGLRKGEKRHIRNGKSGLPVWRLVVRNEKGEEITTPSSPSNWQESEKQPTSDGYVTQWEPLWRIGEGKERNLPAARSCAIWPEATDEELCSPDLETRLRERLPALLEEFRADMEELGFTF